MNLLVVAVPATDLEELLEVFVEVGLGDVTVIDAEAMGGLLAESVPIFAGLRDLLTGRTGAAGGRRMKVVLAAIEDAALLDDAMRGVDDVLGGAAGRRGLAFLLPTASLRTYGG